MREMNCKVNMELSLGLRILNLREKMISGNKEDLLKCRYKESCNQYYKRKRKAIKKKKNYVHQYIINLQSSVDHYAILLSYNH